MPARSPASRWRWSACILKGDRPAAAAVDRHVGDFPRGRAFPMRRACPRFRHRPGSLLFAEAPKLADALWIAEEAARLTALAAVILELRGNPDRLDLTATRRLHRRAQEAGRPVFLLRQAAEAEPTAAPVRFVVAPAPAAPRSTLAGPLAGSIGPPAFTVDDRQEPHRAARRNSFWSGTAMTALFRKDSRRRILVALVPLSQHRTDLAAAAGTVLAFAPAADEAAAGRQPSRQQHPAHRRSRRAG